MTTSANSPLYSEKAQKVLDAVGLLNGSDEPLQILARRIGRALTNFDAGLVLPHRPLASFLLVGHISSPLAQIVETVSDLWVGKPWGGVRSFTYIDCSAYHTPFPNSLARLIGPLPADSIGRQPQPLLSQLEFPHFAARQKNALNGLWSWYRYFLATHAKHLDSLGPQNELPFRLQLGQLVQKEQDRLFQEEQKKDPYRSVLFFDAVDRGNPELVELIRSILLGGRIAVFPNTVAEFSRTLVFLGMYDEDDLLRKEGLGYREHASTSPYHAVRRNLAKQALLSGLAKDMGENIFVLSARTKESQMAQIRSRIACAQEVMRSLGVTVECTESFYAEFLEDTMDQALKAYTDARLRHGLQRHVLYPLARLSLAGRLRRGSRVELGVGGNGGSFSSVRVVEEGTEKLSRGDLEKAFEGEREGTMPKDEFLKDDAIKRLDRDAFERLDAAKRMSRKPV